MATTKSTAFTKELEDLFFDGLKDIFYAEKKITKALPKIVKAVQSGGLVAGFDALLSDQR